MTDYRKSLQTAQIMAQAVPAATSRRKEGQQALEQGWADLGFKSKIPGVSQRFALAVSETGSVLGAATAPTTAPEFMPPRPGFGKVVHINPNPTNG